MTRRAAYAALAGVALVGVLLYGTLSGQKVTCSVVMEFESRRDSATASAANADAAEEQARMTACATISSGMNGRIACGRRVPVRRDCRTV